MVWLLTIAVGASATYFADELKAFYNAIAGVDEAETASGQPPLDAYVGFLDEQSSSYLVPIGQDMSWWNRQEVPNQESRDLHGLIPAGRAQWEIVLVGRRSSAVVVTDIRIHRSGTCDTPPQGSLFEGSSHGGPGTKINLSADLDSTTPVLRSHGDNNPYFDEKTIILPKGESTPITIAAVTSKSHCKWTVELDYVADKSIRHMSIAAPSGKPFEAVGVLTPNDYATVFARNNSDCAHPFRMLSGADYAAIADKTVRPCLP